MIVSRTILLVEDDEDDVFIMKRAFKEAGIVNPLQIVENGEEAVDYLAGRAKFADRHAYPLPAVTFLDLKLPFKSGHDVLRWIQEQRDLDSMVTVVLTSSEEPKDLREAYRLGANSYLVKPPTAEQLTDMARAFKWYWIDYNRFEPKSD